MLKSPHRFTILIALAALSVPVFGKDAKGSKSRGAKVESTRTGAAILWRDPADIPSRDLYFGPGGKQHQPPTTTFTFVEEDLNGTNPKFVVRDQDGVKWTIKPGEEARPETVATRLVWAAGYFANQDYFLPDLRVQDMPLPVKRGKKLIGADGSMQNVRLKRHLEGEKKIDNWSWRDSPFTGTRELNGLRVMMALINNWDLKDANNAVYQDQHSSERIYMVSDLGASFASTGHSFPHRRSKGDLDRYEHSKFIARMSPEYVDFRAPSRPSIMCSGRLISYFQRLHLEWIGKNIPRADARWMGEVLARLSSNQIRDAFRAGGYSPGEVEAFAKIVQDRIAELTGL